MMLNTVVGLVHVHAVIKVYFIQYLQGMFYFFLFFKYNGKLSFAYSESNCIFWNE